MGEVLLPPWVQPVSPEHVAMLDDQTTTFEAALGRAPGQTQSWADPRWQIKRQFKSVRLDERAALRSSLNEARGRGNIIRATIHQSLRGSFPSAELLTNPTFSNGITGWTTDTGWSSSVSDRFARLTMSASTRTVSPLFQTAAVTQYAPHVLRSVTYAGRGQFTTGCFWNSGPNISSSGGGLQSIVHTPLTNTFLVGILEGGASGPIAGDYFASPFMSLARCPLIDNGPNLLAQSDTLGTTWATTHATVSSNVASSPDGTSTADQVVDDATTNSHFISQAATVTSGSADFTAYAYFKSGTKTFCFLQMMTATGSAFVYADLSGGTTGSLTTNSGWANGRVIIAPAGNGWYFLSLTANKTSVDTSLSVLIGTASAIGSSSYLGNGSGVNVWRAGLAQSSVPTRGGQTVGSAVANGTTQSGNGLYVKGLPVSANGLLLADDFFEIGGELKQCTAPLNSDASGLGYLQFRPLLAGAPADNDPVFINQPMGRFKLMNSYEYDNEFGLYMDATVELTEVYG